jgi:hypothetical protein
LYFFTTKTLPALATFMPTLDQGLCAVNLNTKKTKGGGHFEF